MQSMLLTFLADNQQLSIPIYQRRYRWNIEQCEQLWEDIIIQMKYIFSYIYIILKIKRI